MTFANAAKRNTSQHRIVVELHVAIANTQWVNNGAGIWTVNPLNVYSWVDTSLLDGFTAQGFRPLGSIKADARNLQLATSLPDLADTPNAWYPDYQTPMYYVTLPNFDEPSLHTITIGQLYSFSHAEFDAISGLVPIEGRLMNTPSVSESRDPLFWGRLAYPSTSVQLANSDGEFDLWGRDVDIYGNDCRVLVGFEDVAYSDWLRVFHGFMDSATVSEGAFSVTMSDRRKQLSAPIKYACTDTNALTAIEEILADAYGYTFDSTYFDLVAWAAAKAVVANITIDMQKKEPVNQVIEDICGSVFGTFRVDADNLFSFKVVDTDDSIETLIEASDILEPHDISYDPSEVVSSVRVGYAKDWTASAGSAYTYYTDISREATVFAQYKTYNEKTFDTLLVDLAAATAFATRVLDYTDEVYGKETLTVPLENYSVALGDQVGAIIQRGAQTMIGELKAEVTSVEYALDVPLMRIGIRHGGATDAIRTTEAGAIRATEAESIRVEE